jgi:hypothetical protein
VQYSRTSPLRGWIIYSNGGRKKSSHQSANSGSTSDLKNKRGVYVGFRHPSLILLWPNNFYLFIFKGKLTMDDLKISATAISDLHALGKTGEIPNLINAARETIRKGGTVVVEQRLSMQHPRR